VSFIYSTDVNKSHETRIFISIPCNKMLNSENQEQLTITPVTPYLLLSAAYQQAYNDCHISADASSKQRKLARPCQHGHCRD